MVSSQGIGKRHIVTNTGQNQHRCSKHLWHSDQVKAVTVGDTVKPHDGEFAGHGEACIHLQRSRRRGPLNFSDRRAPCTILFRTMRILPQNSLMSCCGGRRLISGQETSAEAISSSYVLSANVFVNETELAFNSHDFADIRAATISAYLSSSSYNHDIPAIPQL